MVVIALIFALLGFLCGSLPFSLWIGRRYAHRDIREVGDGNPGALNVARSGGWRLGLAAGVLDFSKGALPVGVAFRLAGISDWALLPVAVAPVLGHAFSPLLRGRGGKALATTFGIWSGLMFFEGTTALGCCLGVFYLLFDADAWAAILGVAFFGIYLAWRGLPMPYIAVWAMNLSVVTYKHLPSLREGIRLRFAAWGKGRQP